MARGQVVVFCGDPCAVFGRRARLRGLRVAVKRALRVACGPGEQIGLGAIYPGLEFVLVLTLYSHTVPGRVLSMRRAYWIAPLVGVCAVGAFFALRPTDTTAKPGDNNAAGAVAPNLPIKKVVLFSSGVGYFERKGEVDGNARVDLTFQVRDINDLIKSMVLQDEKGLISAVSYDSFDPVERTLKSFAVNLTNNPTFGSVLTQLRGEKAEVVLNQSATNQPGTVTGSIMGLEKQKQTTKE